MEHSWNVFSNLCVQFATESRELAQSLNRSKTPPTNIKTNPAPTVPRPPPCRPPHDRGFRRFDPAEARRIQGLYSHSKKRTARKLLNDVSVTYGGTKIDAENYFEEVFADLLSDTYCRRR